VPSWDFPFRRIGAQNISENIPMQYMLLVYRDETKPDQPEGCHGLAERLDDEGTLVAGGILHPTSCATSVRLREGKRLVTDGPFAETREQLAGYIIVHAENLDDAIVIAAQHPVALDGTIEVRPIYFVPQVTVR
jgi:hypothetical protein